jgi:hypothetical protein
VRSVALAPIVAAGSDTFSSSRQPQLESRVVPVRVSSKVLPAIALDYAYTFTMRKKMDMGSEILISEATISLFHQ